MVPDAEASSQDVISDKLIRDCVQVDGSEEKRTSVPLQQVECLMFSFKHILRIDNLHGLGKLVKLQLDNNLITKIENLDHLVTLQWLDLSFNQITKIEGLDALTQLTDLSLFSNRITELENMEALTNLVSVSIGNNAIKSLENVKYLRRFSSLRLVNLSGNPICKDPDYVNCGLSHIRHLKYFDYRLVTAAAVQAAEEQYQDDMNDMKEKEAEQEARALELAEGTKHKKLMEDANLNGIDTLYDDMIREDPEMARLKTVQGQGQDLTADLYKLKEKSEDYAEPFIKSLLHLNEKKRRERTEFHEAVTQATLDFDTEGQRLIQAFYRTKKVALQEAASGIVPPGGNAAKAAELHSANAKLKDQLMELEVQTVDVLSDMLNDFETHYNQLVEDSKTEFNTFFASVREAENQYWEATTAHANKLLETDNTAGQADGGAGSEEGQRLLQDKDLLLQAVQASHDAHTTHIDSLEDKRVKAELEGFHHLLGDFKARESKRNRDRVTEIWGLIERNKAEIDETLSQEEALEEA